MSNLEIDGNVASPHASIEGSVQPVPYRNIDAVGPAGSIFSSAEDMGAWLRFQLSEGMAGNNRLVESEALLETRRPQILIPHEGPVATFYPDARSLAYGMGWVVSEYRGRRLLDHGGGIDGMTTLVALVPEEGLGVAILTNLQTATPPYWILYPVLDILLGHAPIDRTGEAHAIAEQVENMLRVEPPRVEGTQPSLPLGSYAGAYESPPLGSARVTLEDGRLLFRFGRLGGRLVAWHFDTFRVDWEDHAWRAAAGPGWITFRLDRAGAVEGLELIAIPGEEPWTFERSGS
jgi:CubicO group peptidase (beta-lactamase class C family)